MKNYTTYRHSNKCMGKQNRNVFVFCLHYSTLVACNKTSSSYLNQQKCKVVQSMGNINWKFFKHSKKPSTIVLIIPLPNHTSMGGKFRNMKKIVD